MIAEPQNMPPTPTPVTALPKMKTPLDRAMPQMTEPNWKMAMAANNVPLIWVVFDVAGAHHGQHPGLEVDWKVGIRVMRTS
jgi:hypothetical protein